MSMMKRNLKVIITLVILIFIALAYFLIEQNQRSPASIPAHKKVFIEKNRKEYEKPRSSVRLRGEKVERTEHNTYILRAIAKVGSDQTNELQFIWHLPESARVIHGDANGTLITDESNLIEIEIALDEPNSVAEIGLEAFYFQNGIKLGGVKNFSLNKIDEPSDKFEKAKAAFEYDLQKSQKILQ